MTSSSSPGISLKQEGVSYLAAMELPAVIVNMMRGGPGLGNIAPAQGDYFQATRGGGHGDYRTIVLAPAYGQEIADMTRSAFDLADKYRTPVMILGDGMMGQMMEPVEFPDPIDPQGMVARRMQRPAQQNHPLAMAGHEPGRGAELEARAEIRDHRGRNPGSRDVPHR
jgi:2-oxoglutarate ferredoxin oxidoreductase subunit alpha